jgi:hypothetical protein
MVTIVYYKWEQYLDSSEGKLYEVMKTTCIGCRNTILRGSPYDSVPEIYLSVS